MGNRAGKLSESDVGIDLLALSPVWAPLTAAWLLFVAGYTWAAWRLRQRRGLAGMLIFALVCGAAVIGGGAATALATVPDAGEAAPLAGAISAALLFVPALVGTTWSVARRAGASEQPHPRAADWIHSLAMAIVGLSIPLLVLMTTF